MQPSFREYPLGFAARLAYTVRWIGIGMLAGGGLGFLLGLAASLTVNEAFIDLWYEFDGDPFSRVLVPLLFVALIAGLAVFAVGDSAYNWMLGRKLARQAGLTPTEVPAAWQRAFLARKAPFTGLYAVLWSTFGAALLFALIILAILGETSETELPFVTGMLLVSLATSAASLVLVLVLRRTAGRRWSALVSPAAAVWSPAVISAAASADKERRPRRREQIGLGSAYRRLRTVTRRGTNVGGGVLLAGAVIGFAGVAIRQPCRRCDPRSYGSFGEALIDNLAVIGAVVASLGILVLVVVAVSSVVSTLIADRTLRELLEPPVDENLFPPVELLHARLVGTSLAEASGVVLSGIGTVAVTTGLSMRALELSVPTSVLSGLLGGGIALLLTAAVIVFAGIGATLRVRTRIREQWAPGDVRPAPAPKKPRR